LSNTSKWVKTRALFICAVKWGVTVQKQFTVSITVESFVFQIFLFFLWFEVDLGSISSTFYEQLLHTQITKAHKDSQVVSLYDNFLDLRVKKLEIKCWWNSHLEKFHFVRIDVRLLQSRRESMCEEGKLLNVWKRNITVFDVFLVPSTFLNMTSTLGWSWFWKTFL